MAGQFIGAYITKLVDDAILALGTLTNPLRTDPTGSTTQPVSGSVSLIPLTSGGLSVYAFLSTAAVQAASIKSTPGQVYGIQFFNNSATIAYVRLYNMTTSPGTGDTVVWRGLVPANTSGAGFIVPIANGFAFSLGIGIRVTAAVADNDATALSANVILGNVLYK